MAAAPLVVGEVGASASSTVATGIGSGPLSKYFFFSESLELWLLLCEWLGLFLAFSCTGLASEMGYLRG